MILVNSRVQTRMGAINELAQLLPGATAWEERHDPSLEEAQRQESRALAKRHPIGKVANHDNLGLKARMSREDTAPNSWSFSSVTGSARKL